METTNTPETPSPTTAAAASTGGDASVAEKARRQTSLREGRSTGKQLIGMPVIALADGENKGAVHDVIYSPGEGRLLAFTVTRGGGLFSSGDTFLLDAQSLHALGEDAITITDDTVLQPLGGGSDVRTYEEQAGEPVLGKRLMTENGKFLGAIDDVLVDRQSRRVVAYEVSGGLVHDMMKGQTDVPVDHIISIGHDVVIVPEFVEGQVEEATGGLAAVADAAKQKATQAYEATAEKVAEVRTSTAVALEQKEADFARGKTAGRDVFLDDANTEPLVRQGEIITDAHISRAIPAGKMHALALAAGYAHASDLAESARDKASDLTQAARSKAADLSESAKERYGDTLVGKTTGRAVVSDAGVLIVPDNHVVTETDVFAARSAGKLGDLSAAVGAAYVENARERAGEAYENVRERAAASAATTGAPASSAAAVVPTVIIQNPEQVIVQPGATGEAGVSVSGMPAASDATVSTTPVSTAGNATTTTTP